jgi:hypothetical protein
VIRHMQWGVLGPVYLASDSLLGRHVCLVTLDSTDVE